MKKSIICFSLFVMFCIQSVVSQTISISYPNGGSEEVKYKGSTATGKGIKKNNGELVRYTELSLISTSDFDAFNKIFQKSENRYPNLKVEFTGDKNAYSIQLEKLRKRRTGADVTRAAGGFMTILGVLSGDRGLTAAGLATGAAGQIAREVNNDKTSNTQTAMLNDLDERTKDTGQKAKEPEKSEEDLMREEYGDENVNGLIELIDKNYEKAIAYANVGELSKDANYRLSAMWLKAIIAADQDNETDAQKAYERLVTFDPEISDTKEAKNEIVILLEELEEIRTGE
jgi:hypothetical protein